MLTAQPHIAMLCSICLQVQLPGNHSGTGAGPSCADTYTGQAALYPMTALIPSSLPDGLAISAASHFAYSALQQRLGPSGLANATLDDLEAAMRKAYLLAGVAVPSGATAWSYLPARESQSTVAENRCAGIINCQ